MALTARHIQNFSEAASLEPHWGYADRAVPCTNDPGSCAYLDAVYSAHDRGMIYMGVFWLTIFAILLVWALARRIFPAREPVDDLIARLSKAPATASEPESQQNAQQQQQFFLPRLWRTLLTFSRRHLLPTTPLTSVFGRTTRLQLLLLAILAGYLAIWSFVGITYSRWITPIKNQPAHVKNTRTSLGPWADRVGVLAYALTPLSILLAQRESLLTLLTGVPYTSFLFLHRWTGYLILVQSLLHTLGWVLVEAWLYKPQPTVWRTWVVQDYAIWGFVALGLLVLLWVCSLQVVVHRVVGYEAFRKLHYVLAMVYIGALIGHWKQLQCFLVPGLVLWFVDRFARLVRTGMLHYGYWPSDGAHGFRAAQATPRVWTDAELGDVVRLDFDHPHPPWSVGQHFYLCFPAASIWQSHPFTPLSLPVPDATGLVRHSYIFRAKGGETRRVANLLSSTPSNPQTTTPVILQGPYGAPTTTGLLPSANVLCVAGGTGITYVLPVLLRLVREQSTNTARRIELVWAVKRAQDLQWVEPELAELRARGGAHGVVIRTFVTADGDGAAEKGTGAGKETSVTDDDEDNQTGEGSGNGRPDVKGVVDGFVESVVTGPTTVFGSGPPGMVVELRAAVAGRNEAGRVWRGEESGEVRLVCDDRLEW
ncbi:putative ferric reductase transmembrane component [Staphylotrichum tortipilum]|uniref:Ferric reductase transmembrane component n=1 Tax=Staphylotrichum tortipilum TaxID=2831512 RepID=A0AAN6MFM4_9PEZI|nr:putative ferric reductase transmembrane component [Staphylotrichum longicolle]